MRIRLSLAVFLALSGPAFAGAVKAPVKATITAGETLMRGTIIREAHLQIPSELESMKAEYVGKELRRTLYVGAKLSPALVRNPIVVKRNSRVSMVYRMGALEINAYGRALDEGAVGDVIAVMNLDSRKRIQGVIIADGIIEVS